MLNQRAGCNIPACIKLKIMLSAGVGTAIAAGIGAIATGATAAANAGATARAREENAQYNEIAAQNADKRTRALYKDLYSYEAQVKQLKAAGLNPALLYGGGAGGAAGATPAGAQAQGVQTPPTHYNLGLGDISQIAQIELMQSEARKNNAEANVTEETGTEKAKAEIKNITAHTNLTEVQTAGEKITNQIQQIQKMLLEEYGESKMQYELSKLMWECENLYEVTRKNKVEADVAEATKEEAIKQFQEQTANIIADTTLKKHQVTLTDEETEYYNTMWQVALDDVWNDWERNKIYEKGIDAQIEWIKKQVETLPKEIEIKLKHLENEKTKIIIDGVNDGIRNIGYGVGSYLFMRGAGKGMGIGNPEIKPQVKPQFNREERNYWNKEELRGRKYKIERLDNIYPF